MMNYQACHCKLIFDVFSMGLSMDQPTFDFNLSTIPMYYENYENDILESMTSDSTIIKLKDAPNSKRYECLRCQVRLKLSVRNDLTVVMISSVIKHLI